MPTARNMPLLKRNKTHIILIIILLSLSIQPLSAQQNTSSKKWYIGLNGGANIFWGDIKFNPFWPEAKMQEIQPGGGLIFGRKLNPFLSINTELNYVSLKGKQVFTQDTLAFKTQALSWALKAQFNPIEFLFKKESRFGIYIESGAGVLAWKSLSENISTNDTLNNLGWSNPDKQIAFYIPVGLKFEYQISPQLSAYFVNNYNFVFSDLLEGGVIGGNDAYSYSGFGINYHFSNKKIVSPKLLPYTYFALEYDSIAPQPKEKEKTIDEKEISNPFSLSYLIPETAPHTGFNVQVNIRKIGIAASGFFRLIVPSGFNPKSTNNMDVSFTKLGHRYEYDFIFPMNQDSSSILIPIDLSEIEKGTFPILIEGEIIDQKGNVFPIKTASYTEIVSEDNWYKGLPIKEQEKLDKQKSEGIKTEQQTKDIPHKEDVKNLEVHDEKLDFDTENTSKPILGGMYRIQILAGRKKYDQLASFKQSHNLKENIKENKGDGWFRYTVYETTTIAEANELCQNLRTENNIPEAFVTYYENEERLSIPSNQRSIVSSPQKANSKKPNTSSQKAINKTTKNIDLPIADALVYRIEIAMAFDQPIPLYLLKPKVGKEKIMEFKIESRYYYTIGEFNDSAVAEAFLSYVKSQFKIETAKIVQYQNNRRMNP